MLTSLAWDWKKSACLSLTRKRSTLVTTPKLAWRCADLESRLRVVLTADMVVFYCLFKQFTSGFSLKCAAIECARIRWLDRNAGRRLISPRNFDAFGSGCFAPTQLDGVLRRSDKVCYPVEKPATHRPSSCPLNH